MLGCDVDTVPAVAQFADLPCSAVVPAELAAQQAPAWAPAHPECKRRFPRRRCQGQHLLVALQLKPTMPSLRREPQWLGVYLVDIGRGGVGLLHGEPLYPRERACIALADGNVQHLEIVRCLRLGERCFSIGARFVAPLDGR